MDTNRQSLRNRSLTLLADATGTLEGAGVESANLDAVLLLAAAVGVDRSKLLAGAYSLDDRSIARFHEFIGRRADREPLAYIICRKEFFSLEFEVNHQVLIPRPETELVVDAALRFLAQKPAAAVLDLATGCGAIAIAIAVNAPDARVMATDISTGAIAVARRNAARLGCGSRMEFGAGDCWEALLPCSHRKFDLIVSNPPYVSEPEMARLEPEVARFEPARALLGGKDGVEFYRRIAQGIGSHLAAGGEIIVEVGTGQAAQVATLLGDGGGRVIEVIPDLAGHQRVVRATLPV
jgi:release factor glutamine methyltransferase